MTLPPVPSPNSTVSPGGRRSSRQSRIRVATHHCPDGRCPNARAEFSDASRAASVIVNLRAGSWRGSRRRPWAATQGCGRTYGRRIVRASERPRSGQPARTAEMSHAEPAKVTPSSPLASANAAGAVEMRVPARPRLSLDAIPGLDLLGIGGRRSGGDAGLLLVYSLWDHGNDTPKGRTVSTGTRLTPTSYAILGLLAVRSWSSYELTR